MPRTISRDQLLMILDELDRGELTGDDLHEIVADLELAVTDTQAVDLMLDDALTPEDIADQLLIYPDLSDRPPGA